jgi:hypothetical protein
MYSWMNHCLRSITPKKNNTQLPDIMKNSSAISLAPKFLNRTQNKQQKEELPIKWGLLKYVKEREKNSPGRAVTPVLIANNSGVSLRKVERFKYAPLSITPVRERKESFLIEGVVEERLKKKTENN